MSCERFGILISKWVDGEARAEEVRAVEAHVAECPFCRKLAEEFRRTSALVDAAFAGEPIGQKVSRRVMATIGRRRAAIRWGLRVVAAAALLLTFLLWRADRDAERRELARTVEAALAVVRHMEAALAAERARPAEVVREIVREPFLVHVNESQIPAPSGGRPTEAVTDASESRVASAPHAATIALDRVDAHPDSDTGFVSLAWKMNCSPAAVYFVHRRLEGEESFGEPLNKEGLWTPEFEDRTARGMTSYEYMIVAVTPNGPVFSNVVARVTTPPDLKVVFKGLGTVDGRTVPVFSISTRTGGVWSEPTSWKPEAGERHDATGLFFKSCSIEKQLKVRHVQARENGRSVTKAELYYEHDPRATLITPSGEIKLWSGWRALGSRDRLEVHSPSK